MKNALQLREERAQKLEALRTIDALAEGEKRGLTADEKTKYDAVLAEIRELDSDITRAEAREKLAAQIIAAGGGASNIISEKDARDINKYSFLRAVNAKINDQPLTGIEAEMHQEALNQYRSSGLQVQGNLLIPQEVMALAGTMRTVNATAGTNGDQGGINVQTSVGSVIDRLRAKLVVSGMGATMLDGLVGNVTFPKFVADDQAVVKTEVATSATSSPTFGSVTLTPNRLPVYVEVSRQLLAQTSFSVENMLRDDLAFQIGKVMDATAISTILATSGIGSVVGGTNGAIPTWQNIVDLETAVAAANADYESLGYISNPKVRGKLKGTQKFASSSASSIWSDDNTLNGYKTGISTQIPSNLTKGTASGICSAIIFGNFKDLMIGQWGGLEFLINPYARDTEGLVRINAWTFFDTDVRRAESFAAMKDALTA